MAQPASPSSAAPAQPHMSKRVEAMLGGGLCFVYGWTDGVCYMRYSCFPTMMTGNALLMSISFAHEILPSSDVTTTTVPPGGTKGATAPPRPHIYMEVISSWMIGTAIYKLVKAKVSARAATMFAPVCAAAIAFIEIAEAIGWLENSYRIVCLLAPIFAIGTAAAARGGLSVVTNLMTGHMQRFAFDAVDLLLEDKRIKVLERMAQAFVLVASFMLGGLASNYFSLRFAVDMGHANLFLLTPAGILLSLLLVLNDLWFLPPERNLQSYLDELAELMARNHEPKAKEMMRQMRGSMHSLEGISFAEMESFETKRPASAQALVSP